MNIPRSIELLGRTITIVDAPAVNDKGESVSGTYEHARRTITLGPCYNAQETFELLCHEAAHCHITLTGWDQKLNEREVELLCQLMTNFTVDIINGIAKENKNGRRKDKKQG